MRAPWILSLLAGLFGGLATLAGAGCGDVEVEPDGNSGEDFERGGAQQLFLDKLTDDYIDPEGGDATDWKYFKVQTKGILELTVYWDNKDVEAVIDVRDRFGVLLDSRRHSAELEKDKLDLKVEPGTHFVRLYSAHGASVYTIEGLFQRFDHSPTDDYRPEAITGPGDLFDEPIPEADPRPVAAAGRRGSGRGRPAPPRGERPAALRGLGATITRLIPGAGRKGSLITLNVGSSHGVRRGQSGSIMELEGGPMADGGFRITNVSEKTAQAITNLKPNDIANRRRVQVYLQ